MPALLLRLLALVEDYKRSYNYIIAPFPQKVNFIDLGLKSSKSFVWHVCTYNHIYILCSCMSSLTLLSSVRYMWRQKLARWTRNPLTDLRLEDGKCVFLKNGFANCFTNPVTLPGSEYAKQLKLQIMSWRQQKTISVSRKVWYFSIAEKQNFHLFFSSCATVCVIDKRLNDKEHYNLNAIIIWPLL